MRALFLITASVLVIASAVPSLACEPDSLCEQPETMRYPTLARRIGLNVDAAWIEKNIESIHESFARGCKAYGECLSVWGNPASFCRLLFTGDLRSECDKSWDRSSDLRGWQQCRAVADVFSIGQANDADQAWPAIQQCAAAKYAGQAIESPRVELHPPPLSQEGYDFMVRAFDRESGAPVYGLVTVDGRMVGPTFQSFRYSFGFVRTSDRFGRISLQLPSVKVLASPAPGSEFPGFPETEVPISVPLPKAVLTFDPPPSSWKPGANVVHVTARDEKTGELIDGDVMIPGAVLGDSGEPVTVTLEGSAELCGDPIWFRARRLDYPDETFPIAPCR